MESKKIEIAFANEKPQFMNVDDIKKWEPKNVSKIGSVVLFKVDEKFVTMKKEDYQNIFNIWDRSKYGWKNAKTIIGSNPVINKFLIENDYGKKSQLSADKILNNIPHHLRHYWFRGLIDGDGCFYYHKTNHQRQLFITSTYDQDWSYLEKLCNDLQINYKITKFERINKKTGNKNGYSNFRILGKEIIKFGDYIFQGDDFGLSRKKNKFNEILKSYVSS